LRRLLGFVTPIRIFFWKDRGFPMAEPKRKRTEDEEFEALLAQHMPRSLPKEEGELLDAHVVAVLRDEVLVTYGSKEECPIPVEEFRDPRGVVTVKPGDSVRVLLMGWNEDGEPLLSHRKARSAEAGNMLAEAAEKQVPVRGTVSRVVNGGVIVDVGMPAFMPAGQIDILRIADLSTLVGKEVEAYVLEYDPGQRRAVLSRKKLLAERQDKTRGEFMKTLAPGATLQGTVRDVLEFGVFVDLGGAEGMIPRSELTYDRGVNPSSLLSVGQKVEVKVLEIDEASGRITLSRKRLNEDPWLKIDENYPVGTTVSGKIVSLQSFGAFVQLQEGITGLIHNKDLSWESGRKSASDKFTVGDTVTCQVAEIDKAQKRLGLSVKHLDRDPWMDVEAKFPLGSRRKATVVMLRDFGAIVKLDEFTDALLHISDLSWEKRHKHPSEVLKEGDEVEVVVLNHDRDKRRISVGMKQTAGSPFEKFVQDYPIGAVAKGRISKLERYGAFVELAPGLEGLIHISELDEQRVDSPERVVRLGEELSVKVLEVNREKQRISLSRKQAIRDLEQENIKQYTSRNEKLGSTLGSALKDALKKKS
jgi:small subunit ribosomal protein S1